MEAVRRLIRQVPNFPKAGMVFYDICPVLADPHAFRAVVDALAQPFPAFTHVVGVESRGFILGAALAMRRDCGFVPVRKPGKLPPPTHRETYALEYGEDTLHMQCDALRPTDSVLIVDDVIATGGTLVATHRLVARTGAQVVGAAACITLAALQASKRLAGLTVHTLLTY